MIIWSAGIITWVATRKNAFISTGNVAARSNYDVARPNRTVSNRIKCAWLGFATSFTLPVLGHGLSNYY